MGLEKSLRKWRIAFYCDKSTVDTKRGVTILDTTLRDGEQTPGVSFRPEQKISIAHQLSDIGVDVIETGFSASSDGEFETVKKIYAEEGIRPKICGLARSVKEDGPGEDAMKALLAIASGKKTFIISFTYPKDLTNRLFDLRITD